MNEFHCLSDLSALKVSRGHLDHCPPDALCVEELRRARGLADLMAARYSVQEQISSDPKSWCGIQEIIKKEVDCICLYIWVGQNDVRFWIIQATGAIQFSLVSLDNNKVTGKSP